MAAPIVVVPSATSPGTATTRREYRRALADELGLYAPLTVGVTASAAVTPDAARQVLVTALGSDGVPFEQFDGHYLYVADGAEAGEVRRVLSGTFDGPIGSILLDRPFSSPLASGTAVELTWPLPGRRHLTTKGLNELVDEALARIWVEVRLTVTGNGTREYGLASYPWLYQAFQIRGIYDTQWAAEGDPEELSPYGARFDVSGFGRTLVTDLTYASSETFDLALIARADRYTYDGTSWAYRTTTGLASDAYQAAAPMSHVLAFGMTKALQAWTKLVMVDRAMDRQEKADVLRDIDERKARWARSAVRIKFQEFPKPVQEPSTPLIGVQSPPGWF